MYEIPNSYVDDFAYFDYNVQELKVIILHIKSEKIDYIKYILKDKDAIGFYKMEIVEHI